MNKTRVCSKCGETKPLNSEYFQKDKRNKEGFNARCQVCLAQAKREYYLKNKEDIARKNKKYREENKEQIREMKKKYYRENKEDILNYQKEWYQKNRAKVLQDTKQYKEENEEWYKDYNRKYYQQNREIIKKRASHYSRVNPARKRIWQQNYKAKKRRLPRTLSLEQWEEIKKDFNYQCAYCGMSEDEHIEVYGEKLHKEHFIPLSNNGEFTHNNIIPSCRSCNASKSTQDFFEWYPVYKHYNKEREQFILEYLNYKKQNVQQLSIL